MRKFLVLLTALSLLIIFDATSQVVNPEAVAVEKVVHRLLKVCKRMGGRLILSANTIYQ